MSNPTTPVSPPAPTTPPEKGPHAIQDGLTLIASSPGEWNDTIHLAEVKDNGATGPSVGPFPLFPLETFEERLRSTFPVPLRLHGRTKKKGAFGFFAVYLIELSALASRLDAPRADSPSDARASWAVPPVASSVVPSNPFDGALSVLSVVGALGDRIEAQAEKIAARVNPIAAPPPVDVSALLEAGRSLGEKENPWLAALDKLSGFVVPIGGAIAEAMGARSALMRAHAQQIAAAAEPPAAPQPAAEVNPEPEEAGEPATETDAPAGEGEAKKSDGNIPNGNVPGDERKRRRA